MMSAKPMMPKFSQIGPAVVTFSREDHNADGGNTLAKEIDLFVLSMDGTLMVIHRKGHEYSLRPVIAEGHVG